MALPFPIDQRLKLHFPPLKALLVLCILAAGYGFKLPYDVDYIQGHRCLVVRPADLPDGAPVVLFLHGFGTNGDASYDLCRQLNLPPCLIVLPDAPLSIPHFSSAGHAWYDRFTHSYKDMQNSRDYLFAVMDFFSRETADPSDFGQSHPARPIVLMGESQGGIMSFEAGLNYKGNIAAIVSFCGFIEYPERTLAHPSAPKETPILLVNGERDPVIQTEDVESTVKALRRAGYHPFSSQFPVGHQITAGMLREVSAFVRRALDQKAAPGRNF